VIAPIWAKPKYPGDAVRMQMVIRDDPRFGPEIGDIRIQHYAGMKGGDKVRVAVFLPGVSICSPGDTPKTEPEFNNWYPAADKRKADEAFDEYLKCARDAGWKDYNPNG
jgi:hypothetical protein